MQEKKVAVASSAPPSDEEMNPYTIFPQPEENFKVLLHSSLTYKS
jgi:glutaminyl-tRNA synthetase